MNSSFHDPPFSAYRATAGIINNKVSLRGSVHSGRLMQIICRSIHNSLYGSVFFQDSECCPPALTVDVPYQFCWSKIKAAVTIILLCIACLDNTPHHHQHWSQNVPAAEHSQSVNVEFLDSRVTFQ
jgi:hypothetical protein